MTESPTHPPRKLRPARHAGALPGFRVTAGLTLLYLSLLVLIPLAGLVAKSSTMGWASFCRAAILDPRVQAAYRLSFGTALTAAVINAGFGFIVAWVLARYHFPGKRLLDALVDLPFALPTAVSGIALATLYAPNGWFGRWLDPLGIKVAFTWLGITMALILIGLPFVVRTLQPALGDLEAELEDAAETLGASRAQTFFRVILPTVLPALLTGFALAFARAIGEYGSVVFIAGNLPFKTEIAPLLIVIKLEQFDAAGASAIAVVMLAASFLMLLSINLLQWWSRRHQVAGRG